MASAPYCFRCPLGLERASCGARCASSFERALLEAGGAERTAAVLVEPVGGASCGGIEPPSPYYAWLRSFCDRNELLMIADEVMCGLGRTGQGRALAAHGVFPDILVVGKGLGAGYADVSAVIMSNEIRRTVERGSGITPPVHTFTASLPAIAAGRAVLEVIKRDRLLDNVRQLEQRLHQGLLQLKARHHCVQDVRGRGFLYMVELAEVSGPATTSVMLGEARQDGLLLYPCAGFLEGRRGSGFFVAPPLNTSASEIDHLLGSLDSALGRLPTQTDLQQESARAARSS
jgi:4-aminobutyrate aminotransferase-like enzyme